MQNNEDSILQSWDQRVTPFSPHKDDNEDEEQMSQHEEQNEKTNENAQLQVPSPPDSLQRDPAKTCEFLVRSVRMFSWQNIECFQEWYSLPYKFMWKVTVPAHLLAANDTSLHFEVFLKRKTDNTVIENGMEALLKNKLVTDCGDCILKYSVCFTTTSHFHNKSRFYIEIVYIEPQTNVKKVVVSSPPRMIYCRRKKRKPKK